MMAFPPVSLSQPGHVHSARPSQLEYDFEIRFTTSYLRYQRPGAQHTRVKTSGRCNGVSKACSSCTMTM